MIKRTRRIIFSLLFLLLAFLLVGCKTADTIKLNTEKESLMVGETYQLEATVVPEKAKYKWESSNEKVATVEDGLVTAVAPGRVTVRAISGKLTVAANFEIYGHLDTSYTDELKLTKSFAGKSFIADGIGEVELSQLVDGDTAHFRNKGERFTFTTRFLYINTPESTGRIDPWGKAASSFVGEILRGAEQIVLESSDGKAAQIDATRKRYLGLVWYRNSANEDFRLLNLEIVENAYSNYTGSTGANDNYVDTFIDAAYKAGTSRRRVFGEPDPSFNYTGEVIEVSIAEIKKNFDQYDDGSNLLIEAQIMRIVGDNLYLEDLEATDFDDEIKKAGIYIFSGYGSGLGALKVGTIVRLQCQAVLNDIYGMQLTNPKQVRILDNEDGAEVEYTEVPADFTSLVDYEGYVVIVRNVTVTSVGTPNDEGAYTIYCKTETNAEINFRIDGGAYPKLDYNSIQVGKIYNGIGGVSKFHDTYQVMIGNQTNGINDFVLVSE
jgi:endonuclease YncB( thermonuclease family)